MPPRPRLRLLRQDVPCFTIERDFLLENLAQARDLRTRIIEGGFPPTLASRIVCWLIELGDSDMSDVSPRTLDKYRAVLATIPRDRKH
jgi:hypothetical protein